MIKETETNWDFTNDLKKIYSIWQRWAWLLLLVMALGAASGYLYSRRQLPVYEATTSILVTRSSVSTVADLSQTLSLSQLVDTYVRMLSADEFLDIVSQHVNYHVEMENVDVTAPPNTQMIQLRVQDVDPSRAALTADTMVEVLAEQNETMQAARYADVEQSLISQIEDTEKQVADLQTNLDAAKTTALNEQINRVKENINAMVDAIKITRVELDQLDQSDSEQAFLSTIVEKEYLLETQQSQLEAYQSVYAALLSTGEPKNTTEIDSLKQNLSLYQNTLLSILSNLEDIKKQKLQSMPPIEQIRPALASSKPVRPRTLLNTLLGGAAGLIVSLMFISVREMTDDTVRDPKEVGLLLNTRVIGYIPNIKNDRNGEGIYVRRNPYSAVAEAFRALRTNLEFSARETPVKTILVTSGGYSEGKTTTASNLAAILSQPETNVILVDANLRRPGVHEYAGISNAIGLSDLIGTGRDVPIENSIQKPGPLLNLSILPAGKLASNPTDLLVSEKMQILIHGLSDRYDFVVIDCSPIFTTDAQVLLGLVDGVVLVSGPGKMRREVIDGVNEQVKITGVRLLGLVLNRFKTTTRMDRLKLMPARGSSHRGSAQAGNAPRKFTNDPEDSPDSREVVTS